MRRRRPHSAKLEDQAARLRAERERLEAEHRDLESQVGELEEKRALAKHLGRGDVAKIENQLHAIDVRLATVVPELDDLARALGVLAGEIANSRRIEALDRVIVAKETEAKAATEVEKAEGALTRAESRHEKAVALLDAAEQEADRAEFEAAAVKEAIERGASDPLGDVARARSERERAARRQEGERINWAVRQILGGAPTSLVLQGIPEPLRLEVESRVAAARSSDAREERRRRNIEHAKRTGHGYSEAGEQLVEPKLGHAPAIAATRID